MPRPFVAVNCASSIDGKISSAARRRVQLSSPEDRERVMKLREEFDAIAVGVNTVLADDPLLLPSDSEQWSGRIKRVIFDSRLRTPAGARALKYGNTVIFASRNAEGEIPGASIFRYGEERVDLKKALAKLHEMGVKRLLVEGGGELIFEFFRFRLVDRLIVYTAPLIIGGRSSPTIADGEGFSDPSEFIKLRLISFRKMGEGIITEYESI